MLTYATRNKDYNSGMIVLMSLMVKVLVTLTLWRSMDASFLELPRAAWEARGTMLQYAVPASFYAMSDILRVDVVRATDASTFSILINTRMLFLAFVWQLFMNRRLQLIHWASLTAVLVGCIMKEIPHMEYDVGMGANSRHWAYAEILGLGVITSIATVWNEMLLQKRADVGVNLQNMAMYGWGGMCTLCVTMMWAVFHPSHAVNPFHADAWRAILGEPLVFLSGVILALFGISVAYFLRYLSNITREVTFGAAAPLLSVAMDFFLFKLTLGTLEHIGLVLVLLGVVLFAFKPVLAIDAEDAKKEVFFRVRESSGRESSPCVRR
jgi:drug/metabolite transporter (DMT)-like permease